MNPTIGFHYKFRIHWFLLNPGGVIVQCGRNMKLIEAF